MKGSLGCSEAPASAFPPSLGAQAGSPDVSGDPASSGVPAGYIFLLAALLLAGIGVFVPGWIRRARNRRHVDRHFPVGEIREFRGVLLVHEEIGRFQWYARGRRPGWSDGLHAELFWNGLPPGAVRGPDPRGEPKPVLLVFRGAVLERGSFGPLGDCRYRIQVEDVVKAKPLEPRGEPAAM